MFLDASDDEAFCEGEDSLKHNGLGRQPPAPLPGRDMVFLGGSFTGGRASLATG